MPNNTIEQWMIDTYTDNVRHALQQSESRLERAVMLDPSMKGKKKRYDFIGKAEMQERTGRFAKTKITDNDFYNRWVFTKPYDKASLVSRDDIIPLLRDPTSSIVEAAVKAAKRKKDEVILSAMDATSFIGEDGTTPVAYPNSQIVDIQLDGSGSNTGINLKKLRYAKKVLSKNEIDPDEELFMVITAEQIDELLDIVEVKSVDYNAIKPLVDGKIGRSMGFNFIPTELAPVDENEVRKLFAWNRSSMQLSISRDIETKVSERPDYNYDWQVWTNLHIGGVRLFDEGVVTIPCQEPS